MGSFGDSLHKFAAKSVANAQMVSRKLAFEVFGRVILRTPVDTGRCRANWSVSVGSMKTNTTTATDPTGQATKAAAQSAAMSWNGKGSIFISNNLPYVAKLEYGGYPNPPKHGVKTAGGYSIQAPQGMVRVTVEEMKSYLRTVKP